MASSASANIRTSLIGSGLVSAVGCPASGLSMTGCADVDTDAVVSINPSSAPSTEPAERVTDLAARLSVTVADASWECSVFMNSPRSAQQFSALFQAIRPDLMSDCCGGSRNTGPAGPCPHPFRRFRPVLRGLPSLRFVCLMTADARTG